MKKIKRKNILKAGILLAILLLILPLSVESAQAGVSIGSIHGGLGVGVIITRTAAVTVDWEISVTGGWIVPNTGGRVITGQILSTDYGNDFKIIRFFWGFGFIPISPSAIGPMVFTIKATDTGGPPYTTVTGGPTHLFFVFTW